MIFVLAMQVSSYGMQIYHTGPHPLGKIREENGNIQNYQTSIKYEI